MRCINRKSYFLGKLPRNLDLCWILCLLVEWQQRSDQSLLLTDLIHLNGNPYRSPASEPTDAATASETGIFRVRFWLYCHAIAVVLTAGFALVDSKVISVPTFTDFPLQFVAIPFVAAFYVCPIAILVCILLSSLTPLKRIAVMALEVVIAFLHLYALVPLVQ